jgi:hypothetical protein
MKTITTTQYWVNNRSGKVWSVQQSENDIIIFRSNKTKVISVENLLKNYHKIYTNEKYKN